MGGPAAARTSPPDWLQRSQGHPRPCERPSIHGIHDTQDDPIGTLDPDNDLSVEAETLPH